MGDSNASGKQEFEGRTSWVTSPALWEKLKPLAREKRTQLTAAEYKLWLYLRSRKLSSFKFRRQHPIERFIVDFICHEAHLVIEVDGDIHQFTAVEDAIREEFLIETGLHVIRFANDDVLTNIEGVLETITTSLTSAAPESPAEIKPGFDVS